MAFHDEVAYIEQMRPDQVRLAAEDCHRVGRMITSALPTLDRLPGTIQWESSAAVLYEQRLHETIELVRHLLAGYTRCGDALARYAQQQDQAREVVVQGSLAERELGLLIAPIAATQLPQLRNSAPLHQWNDLRETTGMLDWAAEISQRDEIDKVRWQADMLYRRAASYYDQALEIERRARAEGTEELVVARGWLPDFLANSFYASYLIANIPGLQAEIYEAGSDPNARKPLGVLEEFQVAEDPNMVSYPDGLEGKLAKLAGFEPERITASEAAILDEIGPDGLLRFKQIKEEAYRVAGERFPSPDNSDNQQDAFRHTYWNALMVNEFGEDWAKRFATAHESIANNPAAREAMDLHNNAVGREIAVADPHESNEVIANRVFQAVRDGRTVVIDANGNLAYSDEVSMANTGDPVQTTLPGQPQPANADS
jgi:hypothetical protein